MRRKFRNAQEALDAGAKFCYVVNALSMRDSSGIIPSAVFEDTPGHYPMLGNGPFASPWYWGKTIEGAQVACRHANEKLGHTPEDCVRITASSFAVSFIK